MSFVSDDLQSKMEAAQEAGRILPLRETPDGWFVLTIPWFAVPGYDYAAACRGLSDAGVRQELELDWSQTKGKAVYPEFGRQTHVATTPLKFNPHKPLYCGWDFGGVCAFVPTQINGYGQWLIFPPLVTDEDVSTGTYEFGQMVADYLLREFAGPHGLTLETLKTMHYGDPAGAGPPVRTGDSPKELRSHFEIIRKGIEVHAGQDEFGRPRIQKKPGWGWRIRPGAVNNTERQAAVRARLTLLLQGGLAALVVDPRAQIMIEGFAGGYSYAQRSDGHYEWDPDKNIYSHPMDALAYIATRLFTHGAPEEEDDEDAERAQEFVSHASSRRRTGDY